MIADSMNETAPNGYPQLFIEYRKPAARQAIRRSGVAPQARHLNVPEQSNHAPSAQGEMFR
jgi:hypothetical protein